MNKLFVVTLLAAFLAPQTAMAEQPDRGDGKSSAAQGKKLWAQEFAESGQQRSCATCHGINPGTQGKHVRTGKAIKPMSPTVNPNRLTDVKKVEKWFKRNCKWTMGRQCTAEEKSHFIAYLRNYEEK